MGARLLALAIACLTLGGSASAGVYSPPPGDRCPAWTPDGGSLLYLAGADGSSLHAVRTDGSGDERVASLGPLLITDCFALAPDGMRMAYAGFVAGENRLFLLDGGRRDLGPGYAPTWSPDGTRIAFVRSDGLAVADAATGAVSPLAAGLDAGIWSPDGRHLAAVGLGGLLLVPADGGRIVTLAPPEECCFGHAAWSPDGSRIAVREFVAGAHRVLVVGTAGRNRRALELRRDDTPPAERVESAVVWTPDSRSLLYVGNSQMFALYRLDVRTGSIVRILRLGVRSIVGSTGGLLGLSPDGSRLAFLAGGECRDRVGIYVVGVDGRGLQRLTNSCRIAGTAGADRLVGTPLADVLDGLAGNDRLQALDPGYMGDTLKGGSGDDVLVGGLRQDLLEGGRGQDRLFGGISADLIVGGPGNDAIFGQGGLDVVDAYDGWRDTVSCGTNGRTTKPELDTAYVDRFDRVARDCEVVHRRKRLS